MFGLLPYSLKFPKGSEGATILRKSIYINALCSVSMILILYSFFVVHTQHVFASTESNTMTEVLTTKFNYMMEMLTFLMFVTISYYSAYKNRLTYVNILNAIVSSSNKYRKEASLQQIRVLVKVVTACLGLLFVTQCAVNFTRYGTLWKMMLVTSSFILPQMIQFAVLGFYYVLIVMVVGVLENINGHVQDIINARKFNAAEFVKVEMKIVGLRQMEVVYVNMLETKRQINKAFEASILATTMQCFHSIVSEAHIIYHGLLVDKTLTNHDIFNCAIWIGYQLIKIYIMSRSGNMLKEQCHEMDSVQHDALMLLMLLMHTRCSNAETKILLTDIYYVVVAKIGRSLHNIPAGTEDTTLYLEIQHFSTLILFQNAELTVYNYFPLDATLAFNMMSAAVMYLVMLVQFDRSP